MLNTECSILILSCDKNIGLLNIFFDKIKENWNTCKYKMYLGLENKNFNYKNVEVLNSKYSQYSDRLLDYLSKIDSAFVLVMLDDFIIEKEVNNKIVDSYFEYIYNDKTIATITWTWIDGKIECKYNDYLDKKCYDAKFLVNLQIGFWRKDILENILVFGENAWQVELFGSIRARKYRNLKFLHLNKNIAMPIVYNRGWLVVKGVWNGNELIRLNLNKYVNYFLDGNEIKYNNFYKSNKFNSLRVYFLIFVRRICSRLGWYI